MSIFGQDQSNTVNESVDSNTRALRVKLLLEEVLELAEASGVTLSIGDIVIKDDIITYSVSDEVDIIGIGDALSDIDYVNAGAANVYGLDLEKIHNEVHPSNMSKLWSDEDLKLLPKNGVSVKKVDFHGNVRYVVKRSDGKVLKSPSYKSVNLTKENIGIS